MGILIGTAFFVVALSVVWVVLKRQWDKLSKEILEMAALQALVEFEKKRQEKKDNINETADGDKAQPAVDTANRIINE